MSVADPVPTSAEASARAYFARIAARDLEGAARHWSPEIVEDFVAVGVFRGPAEVRAFFAELFAALPDFTFDLRGLFTPREKGAGEGRGRVGSGGEHVFAEWRATGTHTGGPFLGVEATGRPIDFRGVDHLEMDGGLIVHNTVYYDGMAFARGAGMLPPQGSGAERALFTAFNTVTKARAALRRPAAR